MIMCKIYEYSVMKMQRVGQVTLQDDNRGKGGFVEEENLSHILWAMFGRDTLRRS